MPRVIIVANQTIGGDDLSSAVRDRLATGDCAFHLLVPIPPTPPTAVAAGIAAIECAAALEIEPTDQHAVARERLSCGLQWLADLGAAATGEVSPLDAVAAVLQAVESQHPDEIIVSTLPSRLSKWLRQDLPHRIERAVDIPLTVVTARVSAPVS